MEVFFPEEGLETITFPLDGKDGPLAETEVPVDRSILRGLPNPQIDREVYLQCLREINSSYDVAIDPETGIECEVAGVNLHRVHDGDAVAFTSTRFSSLTQNIGNSIELGGMGAANPNVPILYVAYFGNGRSGDLLAHDKDYFMKTGRLTTGSHIDPDGYQPVSHMEAVERAVVRHFGVSPTHLSANESGGRFGLGLAAASRHNSIKDGYLNGVPGISSVASYSDSEMFVEDVESRKKRRGEDLYQPGKVNSLTKSETRSLMPNIYNMGARHLGRLASTYAKAITGNARMNSRALHGHDDLDDLENHALFQDVMAMLMRHEALVTIQANFEGREDGIGERGQRGIEDCIRFGRLVTQYIPLGMRSEKRGVEFIIGKGKLDAHTDNPADRLATERRALRTIATFMRLVFSGNPDSMLVTTEEIVLPQAAYTQAKID